MYTRMPPYHVHWTGRPTERHILLAISVQSAAARIESVGGVHAVRPSDLTICSTPCCEPVLDLVPEVRALEEMLLDLEDEADQRTTDLRAELTAQLRQCQERPA
ncbi:hypothetical protein ACIBEJ_00820 [Nonomuraea sp. NPDC050790]|uniref:hypothetical protein n=1 Tax=Nonomuraea sp. NPDC050790 TaxID=3364371 RepID=UPI0037896539